MTSSSALRSRLLILTGDSGGPIFQWAGQHWEQVGLVSYGGDCGHASFPGVYTRLSYYYDWIADIMKNNGEYMEPELSSSIGGTTKTSTVIPSTSSNKTTASTITANGQKHRLDAFTFAALALSMIVLIH